MHAKSVTVTDNKLKAQHSRVLLAALLGLVLHGAVKAQQPLPASSADILLRRVDAHYNHLTSIRMSYTETYTGMGMTRTESGMLLLKKPGLMRWQYSKPAGKVFLLDGKYAWFYTPGDPQVQRTDARQMDDLRTPLRFLLGHTELKKELDSVSVRQSGPLLRITGVPRGTKRIQQLVLDVTPIGEILVMSVTQEDGAQTDFRFADSEENVALKANDFRFQVPAGVTVVNGPPPL